MTAFPQRGLFEALPGGAFKARNAIVTGDVTLASDVGVWFGCVVRGDDAPLVIGARTNVQDLTMIHADPGAPNVIGSEVTIGHRCVLHGVRIGDRALIGMGAVLLGGSVVGEEALVAGVPAKILRPLTPDERKHFRESAEGYVQKLRLYLS